jgi:hypothetical protein
MQDNIELPEDNIVETTDTTPYKPKYDWPVLKRYHNRSPIAVGYITKPDDELLTIPDPEKIQLLDEAMEYIQNGRALREVASWLSAELDRPVSHQTVKNMFQRVMGSDKVVPSVDKFLKVRKKNRRGKPLTGQQKAINETKKEIRAIKVRMTAANKRLEKYTEDKTPVVEEVKLPMYIPPDVNAADLVPEDQNVIFKPNPGPQTEFLAASEQEVLYGGSAGGGKSYALLADPMRYFNNPNFMGLLVRRTNDELRELKWKSRELYPKAYPGAIWREKDSMWLFPSGAQFWMTYLERDEDCSRYQGQAFTYIAFDELTHWSTPFAWNYMRSRLRTASSTDKLPVFMRATTNPGGPGHGWVKRMFIDPAPYGKAFNARDLETGEVLSWPKDHPTNAGKPLFQRRFIPAKLSDNPYLYNDGQYEANLLSQNENVRRQLLEGDWSVADGAAFSEFRYKTHVCEPFQIPDTWVKFRSCDYGYSSFSAVHWYAIDPAYETLVVYRELYVTHKTGEELARMIVDMERGERIQYGMLDSSVWHQRGQTGPSIAEVMIAQGCRWRPADRTAGARVNGKNRLHELLKVDEASGTPGIIFFNTCRQIIADLPVIPSDPDGGDDIDVRYPSDHAYDSIRYGIMSRPRSNSPWDFGNGLFDTHRPADKRFGY